jgi:hypothetical protein
VLDGAELELLLVVQARRWPVSLAVDEYEAQGVLAPFRDEDAPDFEFWPRERSRRCSSRTFLMNSLLERAPRPPSMYSRSSDPRRIMDDALIAFGLRQPFGLPLLLFLTASDGSSTSPEFLRGCSWLSGLP